MILHFLFHVEQKILQQNLFSLANWDLKAGYTDLIQSDYSENGFEPQMYEKT